jgi:choline dehydrogenase-like flavoprotein
MLGMVFDRASKADYNSWEDLGNPGWGWDGLFPYFKKVLSVPVFSLTIIHLESALTESIFTHHRAHHLVYLPTRVQPSMGTRGIQAHTVQVQDPFGPPSRHSSGLPAVSGSSEHPCYINSCTYLLILNHMIEPAWDAWGDLNVTTLKEHALGNAVGRYWVPASQNPFNQTRSYARYGYYDTIRTRPNYHLLVGHRAEKLVFSSQSTAKSLKKVVGIIISERFSPDKKFSVKVIKETVLAAGAIHTPQILQISGIGPKNILEAAGIEVEINLSGVGQNLQDHPQASLSCKCERTSAYF